MNLTELKKLLENSTEENIEFDEPHLSLRCKENNIKKEQIVYTLLHETPKLTHFMEDRQNVFKLYFSISKNKQLKIIIDLFKPNKIFVRTIKILDKRLYKNIKFIKRGIY